MGLLNRFNSLANSSATDDALRTVPEANQEEAAVMGGIDFRNAIEIHAKWKLRLKNYIEGNSNEDLKIEVISRDDQCMLGKWLHDEGRAKYGNVKEFLELIELHREFHQCAGQVLRQAQSGQQKRALEMIESGAYAKASVKVSSQIAQLYLQLIN